MYQVQLLGSAKGKNMSLFLFYSYVLIWSVLLFWLDIIMQVLSFLDICCSLSCYELYNHQNGSVLPQFLECIKLEEIFFNKPTWGKVFFNDQLEEVFFQLEIVVCSVLSRPIFFLLTVAIKLCGHTSSHCNNRFLIRCMHCVCKLDVDCWHCIVLRVCIIEQQNFGLSWEWNCYQQMHCSLWQSPKMIPFGDYIGRTIRCVACVNS